MVMGADRQPDLPLLRCASDSLRAARLLLEHDLPNDAAARAFQAMYLAACALLDAVGEARPADQSAAISLFGFRFVKVGGMDLKHYQALRRAYELRRVCECKAERGATAAEAKELIAAADLLVSEAQEYLRGG
jgi:uncharacterized protein (UPF0332 family)